MTKETDQNISDNIIRTLDIVSKALIANSPEEIAKREKELFKYQKLVMVLSTLLVMPQLQMFLEYDAEYIGRTLIERFIGYTSNLDTRVINDLSEKCANTAKFMLEQMNTLL